MSASLASSLDFSGLTERQIARKLKKLTPTELLGLEYHWPTWARSEQLPPDGDWFIWLILSGRGWGKTRTCAEFVRGKIETKEWRRVALVNDTAADTRDVMIEGMDGLVAIAPPWYKPVYEPSKRRLTWPDGQIATAYAAEAPELLRGPQHDGAWCDEPAKWRNLRRPDPQGMTAWDNLMFGLRIGTRPQCVVGTTPRPIKWLRERLKSDRVAVTRGNTYDNRANLSEDYFKEVIARYEGTRLGRQEIGGELLDDVPGALWTRRIIDDLRVDEAPEIVRIVVAIDPAMTSGDDADETGIVAAGKGVDGHAYVLNDLTGHFTPSGWAQRAINLYRELRADRIIGEVNNGGEMVEHTLRSVDSSIPYQAVHASRGKRVRAEPIAALYEQGKVHHVGAFAELEDQMCNFTPDGYDGSPDRLDAMVWALTELMGRDTWVLA